MTLIEGAPQSNDTLVAPVADDDQVITKDGPSVSNVTAISFQSFEQVQTRLILLPKVEEEGLGAVVAGYTPELLSDDDDDDNNNKDANVEKDCPKKPQPTNDSPRQNSSFEELELGENDQGIMGFELVGIETGNVDSRDAHTVVSQRSTEDISDNPGNRSFEKCDFAWILATIRKTPPPILLKFGAPEGSSRRRRISKDGYSFHEEKKGEDHSTDDCASTASTSNAGGDDEDETSDYQSGVDNSKSSFGTSSSWSWRMKAFKETSAQLAAGAASGAAVLASAAKEVAKEHKAMAAVAAAVSGANETTHTDHPPRTREAASSSQRRQVSSQLLQRPPGIFLHTTTGAWLPVRLIDGSVAVAEKKVAELRITNTSMVSVRLSQTEACPSGQYTFQWFRSNGKRPPQWVSSPRSSVDCSISLASGSSNDRHNQHEEWTLIDGAVNAVFQPSATEVGHRLRCVVTCTLCDSEDEEDSCSKEEEAEVKVALEIAGIVFAAQPLFNGARQALVRGAQFAGLSGRGKLEGRSFLLKISMAFIPSTGNEPKQLTSSVVIYQVSGQTAEPMHPEDQPILSVTARCDHSSSKGFELVFVKGIPESAPMIEALATDCSFELEASNRLARESLLFALGIANYAGEPVNLDETTILFDSPSLLPWRPHSKLSLVDSDTDVSDGSTVSDGCRSGISSRSTSPLQQRHDSLLQTPELPPRPLMARPNSSDSGLHKRSLSLGTGDDSSRVQELQEQLEAMQAKLDRKSKVVSELQRRITTTESTFSVMEQKLAACELEREAHESDNKVLRLSLKTVEKRADASESMIQEMRSTHENSIVSLEEQVSSRDEKIAQLEKTVRTLQNEKAVLSAAVEARDSKLSKLSDLQKSFDRLSEKVEENDSLRKEINDVQLRYKAKCEELEASKESEKKQLKDLQAARQHTKQVMESLKKEKNKTASHQTELEAQQMKIQKLIAERNSYRQRGESLSKEIGRVCRNGRTIRDVEKLIADDATRCQEVELLREQKRKLTRELEHYRISYEQSLEAQRMAGMDHNASRLFERNVELERLLSELTEYVNAKEMQLGTLMEVNEALQSEIRDLAKANMSKNDV